MARVYMKIGVLSELVDLIEYLPLRPNQEELAVVSRYDAYEERWVEQIIPVSCLSDPIPE